MGIQHENLRVGKAVANNAVELRGIEIRQLRIEQQNSVVVAALAKLCEGFGAATGFTHTPAGEAQLLLQLAPEPGV